MTTFLGVFFYFITVVIALAAGAMNDKDQKTGGSEGFYCFLAIILIFIIATFCVASGAK